MSHSTVSFCAATDTVFSLLTAALEPAHIDLGKPRPSRLEARRPIYINPIAIRWFHNPQNRIIGTVLHIKRDLRRLISYRP